MGEQNDADQPDCDVDAPRIDFINVRQHETVAGREGEEDDQPAGIHPASEQIQPAHQPITLGEHHRLTLPRRSNDASQVTGLERDFSSIESVLELLKRFQVFDVYEDPVTIFWRQNPSEDMFEDAVHERHSDAPGCVPSSTTDHSLKNMMN